MECEISGKPVICLSFPFRQGAGDAFLGAFAYYLIRHEALAFREKVRRACHYATISVGKEGTQPSYPSRSDLPFSEFFDE